MKLQNKNDKLQVGRKKPQEADCPDDYPRSERLSFCEFDGEFWERGLAWYNDPEIIAATSDDPNPLTPDQFRKLIDRDRLSEHARTFGIQASGGEAIGLVVLRSIDPIHRGADLHITIGEGAFRGKGHGSEAIRATVNFAFDRLGLHKVVSTPFSDNAQMIRCLEKCGFEQEGRLRDALFIGGRFIDVLVMGIINQEK